MRGSLKALVAGCAFFVGGVVQAQDTGPGPAYPAPGSAKGIPGQPMNAPSVGQEEHGQQGGVEPKKHLTAVDLYLSTAERAAKVIYETAQMPQGKMDASFIKEDTGVLERAVNGALVHVGHLKSMPDASITDMASLNELQTELIQARTFTGQLKRVGFSNRMQVASVSSQLYSVLRSADDSFSKIAGEVNLTRVERINVPERQPVGGGTSGQGGSQPSPSFGTDKQLPPSINTDKQLPPSINTDKQMPPSSAPDKQMPPSSAPDKQTPPSGAPYPSQP